MEYNFDAIQLKIASPEEILGWSYGEVTKPETINYRTQRPEKDGLFSERIFGPTKDWECYCGKYRRIRYKGIVCDKCGVEVTRSSVRRDRMGHIKLVAPCVHIWFLRSVPSKLSIVLDMPMAKLERVVYYAAYVVAQVDEEEKNKLKEEAEKEFEAKKKKHEGDDEKLSDLEINKKEVLDDLKEIYVGRVFSESEFYKYSLKYGNAFIASTGGEAIRKMLESMDLPSEIEKLEEETDDKISGTKPKGKLRKQLRRLKLLRNMHNANIRPEWMVLQVLPVLPPDLRPMVALDGGRFATSDLNDLYRRVINRNNRLKKLIELNAPEVIIINEKRMLQESVDALVDNNARFGAQQLSSQRRPLRSLADMLKGKQGRFRQNLLGKRVDYSGRSVIVVGPELGLGQCGLPKKMALELFKPFVINKIIELGLAHNIRNSNRLIEEQPPEVWAILEDVIKNKYVLLNRAPTLHRLGIQAFQPVLIEDFAIRIPPMVCAAFNADFDGDQMAVHVPLTEEAQNEARNLMHSAVNLLKPATGDPITVPTQDIVLGCYYLTKEKENGDGEGGKGEKKVFTGESEAIMAYEMGLVGLGAKVKVRIDKVDNELIETTVGRILFNNTLPNSFRYVNETLTKKKLSKIVAELVNEFGVEDSSSILDKMKKIGFRYATKSGITWSIDELRIPKEKDDILKEAEEKAEEVREQFAEGLLTNTERKAAIIRIWEQARAKIADAVPKSLDPFGSIYQIIDSGARGSWAQPTQMMGMKGLVQNPKGDTIELPVKSSFKEGFDVLEFFISTHGARKGTTDTALKTASAGYLTRRLIDVSQDVVIREKNCRTTKGIVLYRGDGKEFGHNYGERLFSRTLVEDVKDGRKILARKGDIVNREQAEVIDKAESVTEVKVRSPITCRTLYGVCATCYGLDLGYNKPAEEGTAVGIIAAQAIGEPGTQLTMRTFHTGGVSGADITHGLPRVEELFEVRKPKGKAVISAVEGTVSSIEKTEKEILIFIKANKGEDVSTIKTRGRRGKKAKISKKRSEKKAKVIEYSLPLKATLLIEEGDEVQRGQQLSDGNIDLNELFKFTDAETTQRYIIQEVQRIYAGEGASINNKHIEIIVRQMFARVRVTQEGDSPFTLGEIVSRSRVIDVNRKLKKDKKKPAKAKQILMGITKVALSTDSILSAASFQETARILINAATEGSVDHLYGLKENVIIGRLIPAGTGFEDAKDRGRKRSL